MTLLLRTENSPQLNADTAHLQFIDLFAGLGGFHLALARLGHTCVFASESDADLRDLYSDNFKFQPRGDIRRVRTTEIPPHDILCAGFPCQPFSKAGRQEGISCPQFGDLFAQVVRILKSKLPKYLILENVPNLLRHDHGRTWRDMARELHALGYSTDTALISPHHYGVPQIRERLFVVGSLNGLAHLRWPTATGEEPSIYSVLDTNPDEARRLSAQHAKCLDVWQEFLDLVPKEEDLPWFPLWTTEFGATYPFEGVTPWAVGPKELSAFNGSYGTPLRAFPWRLIHEGLPAYARSRTLAFPGWKQKFIRQNREYYWRHQKLLGEWIPKIREFPSSLQKFEWHCAGEERVIARHLIQFRASGVRVKRSNCSPTLVAMNSTQVPVVASQARYMTLRECARLQGLETLPKLPTKPEEAFRALGNAVNADVVTRIAEALLREPRRKSAASRPQVRSFRQVPNAKASADTVRTVSIRPGVSVLSVLKHLNYQPWYALAEFVDNSLQSFIANRRAIESLDGPMAKLQVAIDIDRASSSICIRDNGAGIADADYQRAFRTAALPAERHGLSEFGMGMKSAACWFAPRWTVRTKALGEAREKTIHFDIAEIIRETREELEFTFLPRAKGEHYTELVLSGVYKMPQPKTIGKIRTHLAGIYRTFLRSGLLELRVGGGDGLVFEEPKVLRAPSYRLPKSSPVVWRKPLSIDLGGGRRVHGFAGIREIGSTSGAGFALFRRGRLIQGSADQGYRPERIFGKSNSFVYQRLFGELTLDGLEVSHTKDGFRWDESEDDFLELLKTELDREPLSLIQQARGFRAKTPEKAVLLTNRHAQLEPSIKGRLEREALTGPVTHVSRPRVIARRRTKLERNGTKWEVTLETVNETVTGEWVEIEELSPNRGTRRLRVSIGLKHPFMKGFRARKTSIAPLAKLAAALGIAELTARDAGVRRAEVVRHHLNALLREAFAR